MICKRILIVGLPGSGKSSYAASRLGADLCFDVDYLAGALRLRQEHDEYSRAARLIANALLPQVLSLAEGCADFYGDLYIIRCTPGPLELDRLRPDEIVWCRGAYDVGHRAQTYLGATAGMALKLQRFLDTARRRGIPVTEVGGDGAV